MGASFCTVFESEVARYNGTLGADHRALLLAQRRLDQLAEENGLTPLGAFESYAPEDVAGYAGEDLLAEQPPAEWFDPADGLAAVDALYEYLDARPGNFRDQAAVMEDLSEIGDELEAAQKAGVRFRFAVVP